MNNSPLLEIKNLCIDFNTDTRFFRAVDHISFTLPVAKILGIVGESGSGKSVTALSVLRLLGPGSKSSGEIWFKNGDLPPVDLLKLSDKEIQHIRGNAIGMIFQEPMTSLNPVQKCGKQVVEAIRIHQRFSLKEAKLKTLTLFSEVLLQDPNSIFNSYPHQLSGGQRQRVMIAMAVACNPMLLIADEPTTALDVTVQKSVLSMMKKLQQKYQMGMLFISHDLGVIAEIADEVVVMYQGRIVESGPVQQILHSPSHPYTKGLIACRPRLNSRPDRLPVVEDFLKHSRQSVFSNINHSEKIARLKQHASIYKSNPLIKVKDLSVIYKTDLSFFKRKRTSFRAVDSVSFEVYPGETLGLVGESGCGKTTLGRALLRLIIPYHGQITFMGADLFKMHDRSFRRLRKQMQVIFQDPYSSLNPHLRVGDAILEPMRVHGLSKSDGQGKMKVNELLEKVGLNAGFYQRYPHELSGGERQRICIARALSVNPSFIICDESVSALDVSIQAQVLNLLNDLKRDFGFTSIFISHDLSVVKYMSDRIMVMKEGRIIETDEADSLISNPKKDYTRNLIASIPAGIQ